MLCLIQGKQRNGIIVPIYSTYEETGADPTGGECEYGRLDAMAMLLSATWDCLPDIRAAGEMPGRLSIFNAKEACSIHSTAI